MRVDLSKIVKVPVLYHEFILPRNDIRNLPMWNTLNKTMHEITSREIGKFANLHIRQLLKFIHETVHRKLARQVLEPSEGKAFGRAI